MKQKLNEYCRLTEIISFIQNIDSAVMKGHLAKKLPMGSRVCETNIKKLD